MDTGHFTFDKEADSLLHDIGIEETDSAVLSDEEAASLRDGEIARPEMHRLVPSIARRELVESIEGTEPGEIHSRVMELGKLEAAAGEAVMVEMKPRWLTCVLATMCVVEEHERSETLETS